MFKFSKAMKEKSKLRLAVFGPSGSGKTYTSLRIANGIGGDIALIDTERGSASLYADRFDFDVLELPDYNIDTYVAAINAANKAGYGVLVIDSLTHAWHDLLDEVNRLAKSKYRGNTWSAWSEGTPKQRRLVNAILQFDGHIIATMRTKTEWTTETVNGKSRPSRVGTAPEQGKGIEYEFTLLMELTVDHIATVIKDRTGKFQDNTIDKPGEDFGEALKTWLSTGAEPSKPQESNRKTLPPPEEDTDSPSGNRPQKQRQQKRREQQQPEEKPKSGRDAPFSIADDAARKAFWAHAKGTLGLSEDEVHEALGVESVNDFEGTKGEAADALAAYAEAKSEFERAGPDIGDGENMPLGAGSSRPF